VSRRALEPGSDKTRSRRRATITLNGYGHLMPGNEEQAADLLDAYVMRERSMPQQMI
jgi:hypothetical protein